MNTMLLSVVMEEGAASGFDTLGTAVTFMWDNFTKMASTFLETPILLIPLGIFVIGGAIGLVKRVI